jgi:hypothetical protein
VPRVEHPIDQTYVRNLTATIEGGVVRRGDTVAITGEFELAEGSELPHLSAKLVGSAGGRESVTFGAGPVSTQLIEGNRYSYTAEIVSGTGQRTGQVELLFLMNDPTKYGKLCVYRAPVEVLATPAESDHSVQQVGM